MCQRCQDGLGFENLVAEDFAEEVSRARIAGAAPFRATDADFRARLGQINGADFPRLKWVILMDGSFVVSAHNVGRFEVPHSVLANGERVLAAGEADIAGTDQTGFIAIEITNHSGHYCPCADSLDVGIAALQAVGVDVSGADLVRLERRI